MKDARPSRRSMQIKALLSMGVLVGLGAVSTLAAWTGTATATSSINAATVRLGVGATAVDEASYNVPIGGATWYPGMSQAAMVVVKNSSSIPVPYSITGSVAEASGGALGNALNVVVTVGGSVTGNAPNATCSGTIVMTKPATNAFPAAVPRSTLPAGASETLCVQYSLPAGAANALQGNSTTVTLTFTASVGS